MIKFMFEVSKLLLIKSNNNINQRIEHKFLWYQSRNCINNANDLSIKEIVTTTKEKNSFVNESEIKLIYPDKSVIITTFEEAKKLAIQTNFDLVPISDKSKSSKNTYQLIDVSTKYKFQNVESKTYKEETGKKSTKLFNIKPYITEHDLMIKVNNMNKLLKKKHNIKIFFNHPDGVKVKEVQELLQNIKQKIQGTLLTEKSKKANTILKYSPVLDNTDISLENDNK
ncbi:PREDICTED: uncharacterized protein LOC108551916 [Eufriesea mexicana]|uniref:uncharacterized protein LOC108551916 n=1 Tax=Eufriesea mexicana TaxID=516756 RepID=UPI00083C6CE5|nr:PREDICTED: uncharacterized protein LOC108551916 [Eufriesea mexicana]